jgi:hypothetical protein
VRGFAEQGISRLVTESSWRVRARIALRRGRLPIFHIST